MDCCSSESAATDCPSCGVRGRKVSAVTLDALVSDRAPHDEGWKFCRTLDCPVAYYGDAGVVPTDEVSVPIYQKSTDPDRPVCYCFGYSARDIEQDEAGEIPADIKARCGRGEDRCQQTNPQGSCCLGNVLGLAEQAGVPTTST